MDARARAKQTRTTKKPMLDIDHFAYQSRWLHVNPLLKFALYLALLSFSLLSSPAFQAVLWLLIVPLSCYLVRVSWVRYCRWFSLPLSFLLLSVLGIALSAAQSDTQMLASFSLGSWHIGFERSLILVANAAFWRSLLALAATFLFVLTTPFTQLIFIFKRCHLPHLLVEQILLTYRFIFIFLEESTGIFQAQALRFGYQNPRCAKRSLAMLISMLLERVLRRHQQMSTALAVKLYRGEFYY